MDATLLLFVALLIACPNRGGAQVDVCYVRPGDNLLSPQEVVDLYKSQNLTRIRLLSPNQATLHALRDSNIEIVLGIPNPNLQGIASSNSNAIDWVKSNIVSFLPSVRFWYIAVGYRLIPNSSNAQFILPAMQNIYDTIASTGLQNQIKVSTVVTADLLGTSGIPSQGAFRDDVRVLIDPIILFLAQKGSPLLANLFPYDSYIANPGDISLSNALFTSQSVVVEDGKLRYQNLFDTMVDTLYSALVSASGWPSSGNIGATTENARVYNSNLIQHVKAGTPKRPGKAIETYLFSMFDVNLGNEKGLMPHWGLFYPNKQPKYPINFSSGPTIALH